MRTRLLDHALLFLFRRFDTVAQRLTMALPWTVGGVPMRIPLLHGHGLQNLRIDPADRPLAEAVARVLAHVPGMVVDVGCNIGHFLQLCVLAERQRPYVGFDASLACCFYVEQFIRANALPAHSVLPVGLGQALSVRTLHADSQFDVCASCDDGLHPPGRFREGRRIVIESGDAILSRLGLEDIALIKIDVEGLELEVLRGLERTLAVRRPFLIFEVLQYAHLPAGASSVIRRRRAQARALAAFLLERDYQFLRILQDGRLLPLVDLDPGGNRNPAEMDHLALPRERAAAFLRRAPLAPPVAA